MRERRKKAKKSPWALSVLLAAALVLMGVLGLWLRARNPDYKDQFFLAVPFLWLHNRETPQHPQQLDDQAGEPLPSRPAPKPTHLEETQAPTNPKETTAAAEPTTPETQEPLAVYGQDEHYFDDALFIGDSRMEAMAQYARLGNADYFTEVGMTVFRLFSAQCYDDHFRTTCLEDLLTERQYGKIYIMLGINEAGYALDSLLSTYASDLAEIRRLQPEARIYLLKIYGVSRSQAEDTDWLKPQNLDRINDGIESLCDGKTVFCLDPRGIYEDGSGYLREDCSDDGIHPYAKDLEAMARWLCETAADDPCAGAAP